MTSNFNIYVPPSQTKVKNDLFSQYFQLQNIISPNIKTPAKNNNNNNSNASYCKSITTTRDKENSISTRDISYSSAQTQRTPQKNSKSTFYRPPSNLKQRPKSNNKSVDRSQQSKINNKSLTHRTMNSTVTTNKNTDISNQNISVNEDQKSGVQVSVMEDVSAHKSASKSFIQSNSNSAMKSIQSSESKQFKARKCPSFQVPFTVFKSDKPLTIPKQPDITQATKFKTSRRHEKESYEDLLHRLRNKSMEKIIQKPQHSHSASKLMSDFAKQNYKQINGIIKTANQVNPLKKMQLDNTAKMIKIAELTNQQIE